MGACEYHFIDRWRVRGTVGEVWAIVFDGESLARWWPSTYRAVWQIEPGEPDGLGATFGLRARGWLPYTIRFDFAITGARKPLGFVLQAEGDLSGRGEWSFTQAGDLVDIVYDWRISADKRLLRLLSPVMKPVLRSNHNWTMKKGERSLRVELRRRRGESNVPAPPGPFSLLRR